MPTFSEKHNLLVISFYTFKSELFWRAPLIRTLRIYFIWRLWHKSISLAVKIQSCAYLVVFCRIFRSLNLTVHFLVYPVHKSGVIRTVVAAMDHLNYVIFFQTQLPGKVNFFNSKIIPRFFDLALEFKFLVVLPSEVIETTGAWRWQPNIHVKAFLSSKSEVITAVSYKYLARQ